MPCFCKATQITVPPSDLHLAVRSVPPQLRGLLGLLDLPPVDGLRVDEKLAETLPPGGSSWIGAAIGAQVPGVSLPKVMPPGGGVMMSAMMSLSASAKAFPLHDAKLLLAELQQAVSSAAHNILPQLQSLSSIDQIGLNNMALAARITLALRQKDVDPMTLAQIDMNAQYAGSAAAIQAGFNYAANFPQMNVPPFALSAPQLTLAQTLASMAPMAADGMPSLGDPHLIANFKAQVRMLAAMPLPKLPVTPMMLSALSDLDVVYEAFGPDATSPSGVAKVNAMLNWAASLRLPMPPVALDLTDQLSVTPEVPQVEAGMDAVGSGGASLAASMTTSMSMPPIIPMLETMATLSSVLTKSLGTPPFGPCDACNFPLEAVAQSLAGVAVPPSPPSLPF